MKRVRGVGCVGWRRDEEEGLLLRQEEVVAEEGGLPAWA